MTLAYYNEIDEYAAQWLRNLIKAGHLPPGDVDTRSIEDVEPDDLRPYTQCHFFAGIGVWPRALRRAGWPDDRPVWTGSCPCQPFSVAGKGLGVADERHLWPAFHWLIAQCRPVAILGEQVASKDGYAWLDLVQTDMENTGYAFGAIVAPAAGFGAPHQRHRTYWLAHAEQSAGEQRHELYLQRGWQDDPQQAGMGGISHGLANSHDERHERGGQPWGRGAGPEDDSSHGGMADSHSLRRQRQPQGSGGDGESHDAGQQVLQPGADGDPVGMANPDQEQRGRGATGEGLRPDREAVGRQQGNGEPEPDRQAFELAYSEEGGRGEFRGEAGQGDVRHAHRGIGPVQLANPDVGGRIQRGTGAGFAGAGGSSGTGSRMADPLHEGPQGWLHGGQDKGREGQHGHAGRDSAAGRMGDSTVEPREQHPRTVPRAQARIGGQGQPDGNCALGSEHAGPGVGDTSGGARALANPDGGDPRAEGVQRVWQHGQQPEDRGTLRGPAAGIGDRHIGPDAGPRPTNGYWRDADWIYCRDQKYRPVEPGTFPLAHGAPSRVGRLRAYGNALCAPQAEEFVRACMGAISVRGN